MPGVDIEPLRLSSGRLIRAEVRSEGIRIVIEDRKSVLDSHTIESPEKGFGGGEFYLSPSERYVVFCFYSGQSEEAFALFDLKNKLRNIATTEYQFGEASSFGFSIDEESLVVAIPYLCLEWWQPWDDGEIEEDDAGNQFFDFGRLIVQPTNGVSCSEHLIRIVVEPSWEPDRTEYDPCLSPRFTDQGRLMLHFPWGIESVDLPIARVLTVHPHSA